MDIPIPGLLLSAKHDMSGAGPPFSPASADDGCSIDPARGTMVLGQNVGQAGNPAKFLADREVPNNGFNLRLIGVGRFIVSQVPAINTGESIQADAGININNGFGGQIRLQSNPATPFLITDPSAPIQIVGSNAQVNVGTGAGLNDIVCILTNGAAGNFDIQTAGSVVRFRTQENGNVLIGSIIDNGNLFQVNGAISINNPAAMLVASSAMTNNAGASVGTLTNAPAAGNPTKWIGFNDAGTLRFIPAW